MVACIGELVGQSWGKEGGKERAVKEIERLHPLVIFCFLIAWHGMVCCCCGGCGFVWHGVASVAWHSLRKLLGARETKKNGWVEDDGMAWHGMTWV